MSTTPPLRPTPEPDPAEHGPTSRLVTWTLAKAATVLETLEEFSPATPSSAKRESPSG